MSVVLHGETRRVVALAVLAAVMALVVACSQPPGSPVEHRVHTTWAGSNRPSPSEPRPTPPSGGVRYFDLDWYWGSVRALTTDADVHQLLAAWRSGWGYVDDDPPVVRSGESAVVIRAPNEAFRPVQVTDVRLVDDDIVVMLEIEERDDDGVREGRCVERPTRFRSSDVVVVVVAVEDLTLERVRLGGRMVECAPPADEREA